MARKARVEFSGAVYPRLEGAKRREAIFRDDEDGLSPVFTLQDMTCRTRKLDALFLAIRALSATQHDFRKSLNSRIDPWRANKLPSGQPAASRAGNQEGYGRLVATISGVHSQMVNRVAVAANQALVLRNWLVGGYIVEFKQNGSDRAKYGARLLETLAADLKTQGYTGLGLRVLRDCRTFFTLYPQIRQTLSVESAALMPSREILQTVSTGSPEQLSGETLLRLSWSHFQEFIRLEDPWKRAFYENEVLRGHWSVRQLQRQIGSLLYERTGLSKNKKAVIERARKQESPESIADLLRDPYILEFTGLAERPEYSEQQMEAALLDHLQRFLLELGRGFCFEARQFRMTEGRKHHRVDLVFHHRGLRCHVLLDLKIRAFEPADAGQMNFYVN